MFHKTYLKLAGLYLAILMAISVAFSSVLFQLSTQEFNRSYNQQTHILQQGPSFGLNPAIRNEIFREEREHLDVAKLRVLRRLVVINLCILVAGGALSYILARRTLQPIEESHEALERFTADASHELRTPLAAMRTETEVTLLNPKLTVSEARKQLQSNLEEVQKLTLLSDGLLRLARLERDTVSLGQIDVSAVLRRAVEQVKPLAEKKHIAVETAAAAGLTARGDADSLTEALVILLDNAIKYSEPKTTVRATAQLAQDHIELRIIDEGIGMAAADMKRIFERFYRADSARTRNDSTGYGLGLAIARDIVQLHDGSIHVESTPAKGSTFTIKLPLMKSNAIK